jgi:hypothetical protein
VLPLEKHVPLDAVKHVPSSDEVGPLHANLGLAAVTVKNAPRGVALHIGLGLGANVVGANVGVAVVSTMQSVYPYPIALESDLQSIVDPAETRSPFSAATVFRRVPVPLTRK